MSSNEPCSLPDRGYVPHQQFSLASPLLVCCINGGGFYCRLGCPFSQLRCGFCRPEGSALFFKTSRL